MIAFLTQDATPAPGWLAAVREAFALSDRRRRRLRPAPPARRHEPDDRARADRVLRHLRRRAARLRPTSRRSCRTSTPPTGARAGRRSASTTSPTARTRRSAARSPRTRAGARPTTRGAAVLHAHDYPPVEFMRRYFDEYRGLRETIGHVEPIGAAVDRARRPRRRSPPTAGTCASAGSPARASLDGALGRPPQRPQGVLRARLARRRAPAPRAARAVARGPTRTAAPRPALQRRCRRSCTGATPNFHAYEGVARALQERAGTAAASRIRAMADRERLHIAFVVPTFNIGSGGHNIIFQLMLRLERMGHICSIWVHDLFGHRPHDGAGASCGARSGSRSRRVKAPVFREFDRLVRRRRGRRHRLADRLSRCSSSRACRARAYLINDHEPEFFATSVESRVGGAHVLARASTASPAARGCAISTSTATAARPGTFQYGVDHDVYFPRPIDAPARHGRRLRARGDAAARGRARDPRRSRSCAAAGPTCGSCCSATSKPPYAPFAFEHAGVAEPRGARRGCSRRRRPGSACR